MCWIWDVYSASKGKCQVDNWILSLKFGREIWAGDRNSIFYWLLLGRRIEWVWMEFRALRLCKITWGVGKG
jgi:hypothetical protein